MPSSHLLLTFLIPLLYFLTPSTASPLLPPPQSLSLTSPATPLTNITLLHRPLTITTTRYPVPDTPVTLHFVQGGSPVSFSYLAVALSTGLCKIHPTVLRHPNDPIPWEGWTYLGALTRLIIIVRHWAGADVDLCWQDLKWSLTGLLAFIREDEGNAREWEFEIWREGVGRLGDGVIAGGWGGWGGGGGRGGGGGGGGLREGRGRGCGCRLGAYAYA